MALLTLYTPDSKTKYIYGENKSKVQEAKQSALDALENNLAVLDPAYTAISSDPNLLLLHSYNENNLYGSMIKYRERFIK